MANIEIKDGAAAQKFLGAVGAGSDADPNIPLRAEYADYGYAVASGQLSGTTDIHKFGHNDGIGATFEPISQSGIYMTPQVSGATTLRVKAGGDANDTAAGSGAREITFEGLDETGAYATEVVATAGASASAVTTTTFMRLFRMFVSSSGTYATATAGSHDSAITIENGSGGTDWAVIPVTGFPFGQSEIGVYSVPLGKTAYIKQIGLEVDSTKTPDVILFHRPNILETAAPYTAMRVIQSFIGVVESMNTNYDVPLGPFPALTDIGFMGTVSTGSAAISVDFTIVLVDD